MASIRSKFTGFSGRFDLCLGYPEKRLVTKIGALLNKATSERMSLTQSGKDQLGLQYALDRGDPFYLEQLSGFLTRQYGTGEVRVNSLLATAGASSGLQFLLTSLFPNRGLLFVEDVSYHCALVLFENLNFEVVPVPLTHTGLDLKVLRELAQEKLGPLPNGTQVPRAAVYCNTVYQNPTGVVCSEENCTELVQLARDLGLIVINDDVYNLLYYRSDKSPKRLIAYDEASDANYVGSVVSNGSFSKYLAPGLRLGWIEGPEWLVQKLGIHGLLWSGGGMSGTMSTIIAQALKTGEVDSTIRNTREYYKEKSAACYKLLRDNLAESFQISPQEGGYFLYLKLPSSLNAEKIAKDICQKTGVKLVPSDWFKSGDGPGEFDNSFRISMSFLPEDEIMVALQLICDYLNQLKK